MSGQKRSLTGTVVSDKMEKTVIVLVESTTRHRLYRKILKRSKRYMAHDDRLDAKLGDLVRIVETRPLSRHKRWRVDEIVQRREVAEVAPREIDEAYLTLTREREAPPAPAPAAPAEGVEPAAEAPVAEASAEAAPESEAEAAEAPAEAEAGPEASEEPAEAEAEPETGEEPAEEEPQA